jgi:hypothetical protein
MAKKATRDREFLEAVRHTEVAERYAKAIGKLRSSVGTDLSALEILELEGWLIEECEDARRVAEMPDKFASAREKDKLAKESAQAIAKSAKLIGQFMRQSPHVAGLMLAGALADLRKSGLDVSFATGRLEVGASGKAHFVQDGQPTDLASGVQRFMDQLAASTVKHNIAGKGPFLHNSTIPGLTFNASIVGKKKPIEHATALGFHLVFWLRCMTSDPRSRPAAGAAMPATGQPHYDVANEFVEAALGKSIDCKARLDKHPRGDWQYFGWS